MKSTVFEYQSYKKYLVEILEIRGQSQKGQRSKMSEFIGCQPAYLSQVLNGAADLSPEQSVSVNEFLGHTPAEGRYFLNLVLLARAGTKALRLVYEQEIKKQLEERKVLKTRVQANRKLSEEDQARYYSSWYFAAIHVIVSLAQFKTKQSMAQALNLSPKVVNEALEFLVKIGLLKMNGQEYRQGETSLYLDSDSSFISKHHSNWRMKTLQALEMPQGKDLHYSGVITCSNKDLDKVREILIQTVQTIRSVVKDSEDETIAAYTLDLLSLINENVQSE